MKAKREKNKKSVWDTSAASSAVEHNKEKKEKKYHFVNDEIHFDVLQAKVLTFLCKIVQRKIATLGSWLR